MKRFVLIAVAMFCAFMADAQTGQPECKEMHKVAKKETIFGIAQQYGLTVDEFVDANPELREVKLKKGAYVCIPYTRAEKEAKRAAEAAEQARLEALKVKHFSTIKVGVILPFGASEAQRGNEALKCVEFYRGFLLAVDSLKSIGVNVDVYTYDEKTLGDFNEFLSRPILKQLNLLVGPGRFAHIDALARFATTNGIPMVIPTTTRTTTVQNNGLIYQVSAPLDILYALVADAFVRRFPEANVIFCNASDDASNTEFTNCLKSKINNAGRRYYTCTLSSGDLSQLIRSDRQNVLVPSSASEAAFTELVNKLGTYGNIDQTNDISIFGYTEYQRFAVRQASNLARYKTVYFTPYFDMPYASRTKNFISNYNQWFRENQHTIFPRYGEIGYDIGARFLLSLNAFGDKFDYTKDVGYVSLQTPMRFTQAGQNGSAINTAFQFVVFRKDGTYSLEHY